LAGRLTAVRQNAGVDPHAVLGLDPGASPEQVQRAYRALAKRFHPDRAGEAAGELMISVNAAHDLLLGRLEEQHGHADGAAATPGAEPAPPVEIAGAWLPPAVRRVLARELLAALEADEQVDEVVLTATTDSHDVQLAVTDRRVLWLRDDAIMGRVRYLRHRDVVSVEERPAGRLRRHGQLRVQPASGGRPLRFFELAPDVLARLAARIAMRAGM
jgi:hypothetical protein